MKNRRTILLSVLTTGFVASSLMFGQNLSAVYAQEEQSETSTTMIQTQKFSTEEEAKVWIDSFDTSIYDVTSNIQSESISGVSATPDDRDLADGKLDGYYIELDETNHSAVIHITGGVKSISVGLPYTDENALPNSQFGWSFEFINESGDIYNNVGSSHTDVPLSFWGSGSMEKAINSLGKFDSTYRYILNKYGLNPDSDTFYENHQYDYSVQQVDVTEIPNGVNPTEVTSMTANTEEGYNNGPYYLDTINNVYYVVLQSENPEWVVHVNETNVLEYYNYRLGTSYTDIYTAWSNFFYTCCWKLDYSTALDSIDLNTGQPVTLNVYGDLDGPNTDNMYQMSQWEWSDVISFNCPDKTEYVATVTLTEIPDKPEETPEQPENPEESSDEDKKENEANKKDAETSEGTDTATQTNVGFMVSLASVSACGVALMIVLKKKRV